MAGKRKGVTLLELLIAFSILALVLIPRYGMIGAALSLLGGGLWAVFGFGILVRWKLQRAGENSLVANRLRVVSAAAHGALTADVKPAAKSPTPNRIWAHPPSRWSSTVARPS